MYFPSAENVQVLIHHLNTFLQKELALPGNWSPQLFFRDLKEEAVIDKKTLAELIYQACKSSTSYLEFYQKSRGKERVVTELQKKLLETFEKGMLFLYCDEAFWSLFNQKELTPGQTKLLKYFEALSLYPIETWNDIVRKSGACCYQFFLKESLFYAEVLQRKNQDKEQPEKMTDHELVAKLGLNEINVRESRTELVKRVKN